MKLYVGFEMLVTWKIRARLPHHWLFMMFRKTFCCNAHLCSVGPNIQSSKTNFCRSKSGPPLSPLLHFQSQKLFWKGTIQKVFWTHDFGNLKPNNIMTNIKTFRCCWTCFQESHCITPFKNNFQDGKWSRGERGGWVFDLRKLG